MFKNLGAVDINGQLWHVNLVIRLGSFWVGLHRSSAHDSYCVAFLPCIVLQWTLKEEMPIDCKKELDR